MEKSGLKAKIYEGWSSYYRNGKNILREPHEPIIKLLGDDGNFDYCLDLACGPFNNSDYIASRFQCDVHAVDYVDLSSYSRSSRVHHVCLDLTIPGAIENLINPWASGLILAHQTFDHLPEGEGLNVLERVLQSKFYGVILCSFLTDDCLGSDVVGTKVQGTTSSYVSPISRTGDGLELHTFFNEKVVLKFLDRFKDKIKVTKSFKMDVIGDIPTTYRMSTLYYRLEVSNAAS